MKLVYVFKLTFNGNNLEKKLVRVHLGLDLELDMDTHSHPV
jgi:hypothetical protein